MADATQHFADRNSEGSSTLNPGPGERAGKQAQGLSLLTANPWLIQSLSACRWMLLMTDVPPDIEVTPGTTPVSCPVFSIPMEIPGKLSGQGWWGQAIAPEGTTQKRCWPQLPQASPPQDAPPPNHTCSFWKTRCGPGVVGATPVGPAVLRTRSLKPLC